MRHFIRATPEILIPGSDEEYAYPEIEIEFSYTPGSPARGPSYACGGTPADPPEVEMISATLLSCAEMSPTAAQVEAWASDWMADDDNYGRCCDAAADDIGDQRERAAEARAETRADMEGW